VKFVCWIIDRRDNQIKLYFMPTTVLNAVGGLQMSDDFGFEDVPMPNLGGQLKSGHVWSPENRP